MANHHRIFPQFGQHYSRVLLFYLWPPMLPCWSNSLPNPAKHWSRTKAHNAMGCHTSQVELYVKNAATSHRRCCLEYESDSLRLYIFSWHWSCTRGSIHRQNSFKRFIRICLVLNHLNLPSIKFPQPTSEFQAGVLWLLPCSTPQHIGSCTVLCSLRLRWYWWRQC